MRKKPTTTTVSLWNVTGSVSITSHADEPHKSVSLVDCTVTLGDTETARDLVNGICKVLELDECQHDFLRHLIVLNPDKLKQASREWRAAEHLAEAGAMTHAEIATVVRGGK